MEVEKKITELKEQGFDPVYVWTAVSNEEDLDHVHPFDTKLVVIEGEIEIKLDGVSRVIKPNEELNIPQEKVHYGKAGQNGCRYIVAEKH